MKVTATLNISEFIKYIENKDKDNVLEPKQKIKVKSFDNIDEFINYLYAHAFSDIIKDAEENE